MKPGSFRLPSSSEPGLLSWNFQMSATSLLEEAELCRTRALSRLGRPEAPFLFKMASEFERLAHQKMLGGR